MDNSYCKNIKNTVKQSEEEKKQNELNVKVEKLQKLLKYANLNKNKEKLSKDNLHIFKFLDKNGKKCTALEAVKVEFTCQGETIDFDIPKERLSDNDKTNIDRGCFVLKISDNYKCTIADNFSCIYFTNCFDDTRYDNEGSNHAIYSLPECGISYNSTTKGFSYSPKELYESGIGGLAKEANTKPVNNEITQSDFVNNLFVFDKDTSIRERNYCVNEAFEKANESVISNYMRQEIRLSIIDIILEFFGFKSSKKCEKDNSINNSDNNISKDEFDKFLQKKEKITELLGDEGDEDLKDVLSKNNEFKSIIANEDFLKLLCNYLTASEALQVAVSNIVSEQKQGSIITDSMSTRYFFDSTLSKMNLDLRLKMFEIVSEEKENTDDIKSSYKELSGDLSCLNTNFNKVDVNEQQSLLQNVENDIKKINEHIDYRLGEIGKNSLNDNFTSFLSRIARKSDKIIESDKIYER